MLDPARLDALLRRGPAVRPLVEAFQDVDGRRRKLQGELDALRAERNEKSKGAAAAANREALRALSQRIKEGAEELSRLEAETREKQLWLPNAPHASVPDGEGEAGNVVVSTWG